MTREEAKDYIREWCPYDRQEEIIKALEQGPCEDAISRQAMLVNQKTGHWIVHPKGIYAHLVCDKCLSNAPYDCQTNYCPNCGAKMESEIHCNYTDTEISKSFIEDVEAVKDLLPRTTK